MAINTAVDFKKKFGQPTAAPVAEQRPKAVFWINIGYDSGVPEENGDGTRFVSLPVGVPLDSQEKLPTNSSNPTFAAFQGARNDLLEQIMAVANQLEAGQSTMLNLQVQLRKVNEEKAVDMANNPFAKKLSLVG